MNTLDDVRAKYPHLGAATYAFAPNGPVTVEFFADGKLIGTWTGPTEAAAISKAFPDEDEPVAAPVPSALPTPSVFD